MYKKQKTSSRSRILIIVMLLILAGAITAGAYLAIFKDNDNTGEENNATNKINLEPPTEQEQAAGDKQKEEIIDEEENTSVPDGAEVIIVDANQYDQEIEVRAFVSNLVEDGTCTITFTKADLKIVKEVPANADASSTPCVTLTLPRSEFSETGTWDVSVTYSNTRIMGTTSGTMEIQ